MVSSMRDGMRGVGLVIVVLALAGCAASRPPAKVEPLSFTGRGVIALDAATIQVVEQYRAPMAKPNVDQLAPTPPARAVRQWAGERLRAVGRGGAVRVIILDARIVETELPRAEGFKSAFTTQQAQRYDGRIEVRVVGEAPALRFSGSAQAAASRSITVPEDISLAGREDVWNTLVRQMMEDLDVRLEQSLRDGLGPMLRR